MNVMLCLLSDQPIPNLLSVHHFKPDRLILVESEDMRKKKTADHFLQALQCGGLDYARRVEISPLDLVDNIEAVRECLMTTYGAYASAQWIANLTGGTKLMSIAAYEFFKAVGARLVYINAARPDEMLRLDGSQPEICSHRLSIAAFLAAYGFTSTKSDKKIAEAEARARQWWPAARIIAEYIPARDLLSMGREEWAAIREKGLELKPVHEVKQKDSPAPTDFDVAFIRRHAFGVIECKSGAQEQVDDPHAPLDKLEARSQQFRPLRVNPILATTSTSPKMLDAKGQLKANIAARARLYNSRIVTAPQIQDLARHWDSAEKVREVLFA